VAAVYSPDRPANVIAYKHVFVDRVTAGDSFYNGNLLSVVSALHLKKNLHFGQLDAGINGDTVEAYRARLRNRPNFLIATDPGREVFPPPVSQAFAEEAARSLGFELVVTFTLPDGRQTRIWWLDRGPSS
jgi:hypothetical protein